MPRSLTLTGAAAAGSTVEIFDGATELGTTTTNGSGAWSYTTATLGDGSHSFTAKAMDAAGNVSVASTAMAVTVDTVAPAAPVIANDSVNGSNVTFTGSAEANSTVTVYDGQTALGSTTANGNGAWSYTTSPGTLTNGAQTFTATATDAAGNTSPASNSVGLPTTVIQVDGSTSLTQIGNQFYLYNSGGSGPALKYSGADVVAGQFGSWTPFGAVQTASGYDVAWKIPGANTYTVWSTDSNGNFISALVNTVPGTNTALEALETTFGQDLNGDGIMGVPAPTPTISSFSPDSGVVGDDITNATILTLTGAAAANSTVTVYDGATELGTTTANGSGAWSYTTGTLANGSHSLTATDTVAGNVSTASPALTVTVDTVPPAAPSIANDTINSNNSVTLSGTAAANSTVTVYDETDRSRYHDSERQRHLDLHDRHAGLGSTSLYCDGNRRRGKCERRIGSS